MSRNTLNHKLRTLLSHSRRNTKVEDSKKRKEIDDLTIRLLKEEAERKKG